MIEEGLKNRFLSNFVKNDGGKMEFLDMRTLQWMNLFGLTYSQIDQNSSWL